MRKVFLPALMIFCMVTDTLLLAAFWEEVNFGARYHLHTCGMEQKGHIHSHDFDDTLLLHPHKEFYDRDCIIHGLQREKQNAQVDQKSLSLERNLPAETRQ